MVCVGIDSVRMVTMIVAVRVITMGMAVRCGLWFQFKWTVLAKACAVSRGVTILAFSCTHAFDMMMMALLHRADFRFKAQHLRAIFAHLAIHRRLA